MVTTLVVLLVISKEALVVHSTRLAAVFSLCAGMTLKSRSGGLRVTRFPKISRAGIQTPIIGGSPLLTGLATVVISPTRSVNTVVCSTRPLVLSEVTERSLPAPFSVVINISVCGDWAGSAYPGGTTACSNAVSNAANYNSTHLFSTLFPDIADADHCCRRSDHDQLHLSLPTGLSATFEGLSPSTVFFSTRARVPHIKDDYSTERISILSFISTVYTTEQDSVTNITLSSGESNRWVVCVFVPLGIRYCWSLWTP